MTEDIEPLKTDRWQCLRCGNEFEVVRGEIPVYCENPNCRKKGPFKALSGPYSYFEGKRFVPRRLAEEIMKKYPDLPKEKNAGRIIAREARLALGELARPNYVGSVIRYIKNSEFFMKGEAPAAASEGEKTVRVQISSLITDDFIAEEVYDGVLPSFIVYRFNEGKFERVLEIPGDTLPNGRTVVYTPVDNDHLRKGMVVLPREPKEATFSEVLEDIFGFLLNDRSFDPCGRESDVMLLGLIAAGSWFLDKMKPTLAVKVSGIGLFAPIIAIRGPSGSGKNRLANLLRMLCYRPYFDMSKTKIPSLFRPLDIWKGTLVLDEADFERTEETSELIHFLNCRAQGTPIARQDPANPKESQAFENFGLTIVTQRRQFEDNATEGRTIPFLSEKTDEKLPTVELDETVERGLEIQNKLLYLRLKYWKEFKIDKTAWIEGIGDPRLNAALLPVLGIAKFEPKVLEIVEKVVKKVEERKKRLKANSQDGIIVNFLWDRIQNGLFDRWMLYYYIVEDQGGVRVPLSSSQVAEILGWKSRNVRKVLYSLNVAPDEAPDIAKIEGKTYRPIFFEPRRLEKLLAEFVVEYRKGELFKKLGAPTQTTLDAASVTQVTQVTHPQVCPRNAEVTQVTEQKLGVVNFDKVTQVTDKEPDEKVTQVTELSHFYNQNHNGSKLEIQKKEGFYEQKESVSRELLSKPDFIGGDAEKQPPEGIITKSDGNTQGRSVTCVTSVTTSLSQVFEAIASYAGAVVAKEKLAAEIGIPPEKLDAILEELRKRGKIIDRGAFVEVVR